MLTQKGYALVAGAISVVGLGAFTGVSYLALAALPLISYLVIGRLLSNNPHTGLRVRRGGGASRIMQGDAVTYTVYIENRGKDIDHLEVVDSIPPAYSVVMGTNRYQLALPSGARASFSYTVTVRVPGQFQTGPILLRASDGNGFSEETSVVQEVATLRVFPLVESARAHLRLVELRNWPGELVSRKPGTGLEFHSIREYTAGDVLKRVNWKAYARLQKLFTNQFTAELAGEAMIVLDGRIYQPQTGDEGVVPDRSASAAATIAYALIRDRNRVGLVVMGDILEKVYPATGRRQLDRMLLLLSSFTPGRRWRISIVSHYLRLLFPSISDVVLVTSSPDDEVVRAVADLKMNGYNTTVVSAPPARFEYPGVSKDANELANLLVALKRSTILHDIRRFANVIEWEGEEPLALYLQERSLRMVRSR